VRNFKTCRSFKLGGALLLVLWQRSDPLLVVPVRLSAGNFAVCVSCCQDADLPNLNPPHVAPPVYSVFRAPDRVLSDAYWWLLFIGYKGVGRWSWSLWLSGATSPKLCLTIFYLYILWCCTTQRGCRTSKLKTPVEAASINMKTWKGNYTITICVWLYFTYIFCDLCATSSAQVDNL
jgi:hypothetical protein